MTGPTPYPRVAGRSTLWWGALWSMVVFANMLATIVFASMYLRQGAPRWPPEGIDLPDPGLALALSAVAVVSIAPAGLAHRSVRTGSLARAQGAALVAAATGVVVLVLAAYDLAAFGVAHDVHAFASVHWTAMVFHMAVTAAAVAGLVLVPLRARGADMAPRDQDSIVAAAMLWYYAAGAWPVVVLAVHVVPRM